MSLHLVGVDWGALTSSLFTSAAQASQGVAAATKKAPAPGAPGAPKALGTPGAPGAAGATGQGDMSTWTDAQWAEYDKKQAAAAGPAPGSTGGQAKSMPAWKIGALAGGGLAVLTGIILLAKKAFGK